MLRVVVDRGSLPITRIAMYANLPLDRARRILVELMNAGLLVFNPETRRYEATDLAYMWLELYRLLSNLYDPCRRGGEPPH